jgi:hypothetical protein
MIKNIYKWTGVLYDIANMPWMHHHKHKRQDLFLPFMFIRDVRSLEPTRSRFDKEAPADFRMPVSD